MKQMRGRGCGMGTLTALIGTGRTICCTKGGNSDHYGIQIIYTAYTHTLTYTFTKSYHTTHKEKENSNEILTWCVMTLKWKYFMLLI